MSRFTLADLDAIIAARADAAPDESWTAKLLASGTQRIAKKFGEEAMETIIAAVGNDRDALKAEAADVLYHLLVLLHAGKVPLTDVLVELERRTGQSGLEEKAKRGS
jgi:phosphoribosyl-ATP pyrophosphohydrolase